MFSFLLAVASRQGKCTVRSTLVTVTKNNYQSLIGKGTPFFLRLIYNGCSYATSSEDSWRTASEIFPSITFGQIECFGNPETCKNFGFYVSPSHILFAANSTEKLNEVNGADDALNTPAGFENIIKNSLDIYPIDNPPMKQLAPFSTDNFYKSHKHPIFVLHDSTCKEDAEFLSQWVKASVKETFSKDADVGFGRLDCSQYPDECSRWGTTYPAAVIYSNKNGAKETITASSSISQNIVKAINNLDGASSVPAPTPVPTVAPTPVPTPIAVDSTIKNEEFEKRAINTIKSEYSKAFAFTSETPYSETTPNIEKCEDTTFSQSDVDDAMRRLNFYRMLAGVPNPIPNNVSLNDGCYQTAKVLASAKYITHYPSDDIINVCGSKYNSIVKNVAMNSNLAQGKNRASEAMQGLMYDSGENNKGVMGHRRWMLYPYLPSVGIGFYQNSLIQKTGYLFSYPAVAVVQVNGDHAPYNPTPYTSRPFVAWPAPGPFPLNELPESWSIYHPDFALEDTKLEDIIVKITRDDDTTIDVNKLYLEKRYFGHPGHLIIELSSLGLSQCLAGHKIHVQVYLMKTSKKCIDYTFEIFDDKTQESVCFYETDDSKCPSTIPASNRYGKGKYASYTPLSVERVIIYVAETLKPTSPLRLDFANKIIVSQGKIQGNIVIGTKTECEVLYPELSDITIEAAAGSSLVTGKLVTSKQAHSISISIIGTPTATTQIRNVVYSGTPMFIKILQESIENGDYKYNFNLFYKGNDVSLTCIYVFQVSQYVIGTNNYAPKKDIIKLGSVNDISSISTPNKKVRIYFQAYAQVNMSCFPAESHDYEFYTWGRLTIYYNKDKANVFNSLTISPLPVFSSSTLAFDVEQEDTLTKETRLLFFKSLTIINHRYSSYYYVPSGVLTADASITSYMQPELYYKEFTDSDFSNGVFTLQNSNNNWCACPIFTTESKLTKYTMYRTKDVKEGYANYAAFRPKAGFENTPFNFEVSKRDEDEYYTPLFYNYHTVILTANQEFHNRAKFFNVSKVVRKNIDGTGGIRVDSIEITSSESDISSEDDAKVIYSNISISSDSVVKAKGTDVVNLIINSCTATIKELSIRNSINVSNSNIKLQSCNVGNNVVIALAKGEKYPSLDISGSTFNPASITCDLGIAPKARKSLADSGETHVIISGITKGEADTILGKITLINSGDFRLEKSSDDTSIVVTNEEVSQEKGNNPDTNNKSNTGMIVGIVIAVVAVIAIAVILVYVFVIKSKNEKEEEPAISEAVFSV